MYQLTSLNNDVYCLILRELPKQDSLRLSTTCRTLREALVPMLFGCAFVSVGSPRIVADSNYFMPASLRPYVHTLAIHDSCPDQRRKRNACRYTSDPRRCGAFPNHDALAARLQELPNLCSVTIRKKKSVVHGLGWNAVLAILSVPHLREVAFIGMYICPLMYPEEDIHINPHSLAPLTSFHYQITHSPWAVNIPTETAALAVVLTELHEGLETLTLTSESAPLSILASLCWPRLRKLAFYGTPWTESRPMLGTILANMHHLRELSFKLYTTAPPQTYDCLQLSSPLERLVLSNPNPKDHIFENLPSTLCSLSLRHWPHLHYQQYLRDIVPDVYGDPIYNTLLSSSDMFSILRRCAGLSLERLEIEYRADEEEDSLLQFVAVEFPHLASLKLHRYRSVLEQQEGRDVSARHLAELLAPLARLGRFKVFLDFADLPRPDFVTFGPRSGYKLVYNPSQVQRCQDITLNTATAFAQILSSTLRVLMVRNVDMAGPMWREFVVDDRRLLITNQ